MLKRVLAVVTSACMLLAGMCPAECAAAENTRTASIQFTNIFETKNIKNYKFVSGNYTEKLIRDNRECIRFSSEPKTTYIYLNLDDDVFWFPEGVEAKVTVDYFDEGHGKFTLRYGSVDEEYCDNAEIVNLENTQVWKTHTFEIQNAVFTNKISTGYDIILGEYSKYMGRSSEEVIFGGMTIEYIPVPVKASIASEQYGNIFSMDDNKSLTVSVDNVMGKKTNLTFDYQVFDEWNNRLFADKVSCDIPPAGAEFSINIPLDKYGIYTLKGEISCADADGSTYKKTLEEEFSVINTFSAEEKHNENLGISTHFKRYTTDDNMTKASTVFSKMGAGISRSEHYWASTELSKGIMTLQPFAQMPGRLKNGGVETLMILDYGNPLYSTSGVTNEIPTEGEFLEKFVDYCKFMANTYKGVIKYYEIWNEPNNSQFNVTSVTPEGYAKMLKRVYTELKQIDPEITVVGCATVHVPYDWLKRVFDAGGYDYLDAVSIHPYDRSAGFRKDYMRDNVQRIRELELEYGEQKDIWYTEVGWTTATDPAWGVKEYVRPTYAVETYVMSIAEGLANKIIWYDFQNIGNSNRPSEHNYGTVRNFEGIDSPWSARNIYVAFAAMNKMIGNAEPEEYMVREDGLAVYKFKRPDGKRVLVVWSENDNQTVALKLNTNSLEKYDIYSNSEGVLSGDNGVFLLSAESEPAYYMGDFDGFEEAESNIFVDIDNCSVTYGDSVNISAEDKLGRNLRIEATANGEVSASSDGSVRVKLASGDERSKINIRVYSDDKLYYSGCQTVTFTEPIKMTIEPKQTTSRRYAAQLTVTNNSVEQSVSGKAYLTLDGGVYTSNEVRFTDVPPRQSQSFEICLPEMTKAALHDIEVNVTADDGSVYKDVGTYDFTFAGYCETPPVIDGELSVNEWTAGWFTAENEDAAVNVKNWGGKDDISFSMNAMWDEKNLYIAAMVKDDIHSQKFVDRATWSGDSIQIGISNPEDPVTDYTVYTSLLTALEEGGPKLSRFGSNYTAEIGELTLASCAIKRGDDCTIYELAIPWSEIFYDGYVPNENRTIGFSAIANDNDGDGRKGWVEYTSGIGTSKDCRKFGTMHFVK